MGRTPPGGWAVQDTGPRKGNRRDRLGHQGRGWQDKRPPGLHAKAEDTVRRKWGGWSRRAITAERCGRRRARTVRLEDGAPALPSNPPRRAGPPDGQGGTSEYGPT